MVLQVEDAIIPAYSAKEQESLIQLADIRRSAVAIGNAEALL